MEKREESVISIQKAYKSLIRKREVFAFAKKNIYNYSIYPSFLSEKDIKNKINLKIRLYKDLLKSDYYVLPLKFCDFRKCYVFDFPKNQFNSKRKKIMNFTFVLNNNKVIIDPEYKKVRLGHDYVNQIDFSKLDKKEKLNNKFFKLKEELNSDSSSNNNSEKYKKDENNGLNRNIINLNKLHSSKSSALLLSNTLSNSTKDSINQATPTYKKGRKKRKSILKNREGSFANIRENRSPKKRVSFGSSQISFYKSELYK